MKGITTIEWLVIIAIIGLVASMLFFGSGADSWLNKPIKDLTVKDIIILKFIFD